MLQPNAVPASTLALLRQISSLDELKSFGLGGGTNIALRLGHRLSVDLDYFTNADFETTSLLHLITKKFSSSELLFEKNQTIMFNINDIKVDFVLYPFPWLKPFEVIDGIRFIHFTDMIPMKLQAIGNRRLKRDYWDISALLGKFPFSDMIKIFKLKFPQIDTGYIIHSLTDFEKAETEPDPDVFDNTTWEDVKQRLTSAVREYTLGLL